ncbi:hypothetical protein B0T14DRAFT_440978, partial [Immersiella caudata]
QFRSAGEGMRWQSQATLALQEVAEAFVVYLFEDSYLRSIHARRVTLMAEYIQLVRRLRGVWAGLPSSSGGWGV